jgi:hypothetical protein
MSAFPPKIKQLPIVRRLLRGLYDYHFSTAPGWQRMFNGVYSSFEEATTSAFFWAEKSLARVRLCV